MDEECPVGPERETDLTRRLEEGQALDVTDGSSYLTDNNIVTGQMTPSTADLIMSVTWGITWTVLPRYSPLRSLRMIDS